mgnify:CR=1 FL=1|jgi:hypothetical protein
MKILKYNIKLEKYRIGVWLIILYHKLIKYNKKIIFRDEKLNYLYSVYNKTYNNERALEIPIAKNILKRFKGGEILEIGNVLNHYINVKHVVVDKYEKYPGVINSDIIEFNSEIKFDLIISISTFEHIGFDEYSRYSDQQNDRSDSKNKLIAAFSKMTELLKDNGKFIFTSPIGYNPSLDELIRKNEIPNMKTSFYKRISENNEWTIATDLNWENIKYGQPYPAANFLIIGELS